MELCQLTEVEQERAQRAESYRTQYEEKAYRYLPDYMKKRAKRNVAVAFKILHGHISQTCSLRMRVFAWRLTAITIRIEFPKMLAETGFLRATILRQYG